MKLMGVVYKLNNKVHQRGVGSNNKAPNYAIAYKFPSMIVETILLGIEWSMGKNGLLSPVGLLKEVQIGSVTITRVNLYNCNYIEQNDLRVNDFVQIERAGDVIPKINNISINKRSNYSVPYIIPIICPYCSTPLVKKENKLRCNNLNCKGKLIATTVHFVSKGVLTFLTWDIID